MLRHSQTGFNIKTKKRKLQIGGHKVIKKIKCHLLIPTLDMLCTVHSNCYSN